MGSRETVVYISGPYSNGGTESDFKRKENVATARRAAIEYWRLGYTVICPHLNTHELDKDGVTYAEIMEGDLELVRRSDLVVMLPGWEKSEGARAEYREALFYDIPVEFWGEDEALHALIKGGV